LEFLYFLLEKGFSYTEIRQMSIKRLKLVLEEFVKIEKENQKQIEKFSEDKDT